VDPGAHSEIHEYLPPKTGVEKMVQVALLPVFRAVGTRFLSPTRDLGRYLTELAMGDGKALSGAGVEGEGRTITNTGFRRLAGL
jgi:hypothetical protein